MRHRRTTTRTTRLAGPPPGRAWAAVATAGLVLLAGCGPDAGARAAGPGRTGATGSTGAASAASSATDRPGASGAAAPTAPATASATTPASTARPGSSRAATLPAVPATGAGPRVRFPVNPPAVGAGAHATVGPVPDAMWVRMRGYSWTPGCPVGRSSLALVGVNFWGFDGVRSRGELVVASRIAASAARAFTRLYDLRFRIRQMRVMDSSWGHNPRGPGADDYAAMEADNTSAFNCRYVGGQESRRVYSGHAYGRAIDVNDFENPYVDDTGRVYPDSWFLHRRAPVDGVLASGSAAVRAFTDLGLTWGGRWSAPDYQHFEVTR